VLEHCTELALPQRAQLPRHSQLPVGATDEPLRRKPCHRLDRIVDVQMTKV